MLTPTLSVEVEGLVRAAYGALLALTLVSILPHSRRYFVSERWSGYAQSNVWTDAVQNPVVSSVVMLVWLACAVLLMLGRWTVAAAAVNLAFCHYYFIRMRWHGVLRGMGAPGFIAFWLGAAVFLLELTTRHAPAVRGLALFALQVDFALIMVSAGVYKMLSGYRSRDGMELGMVNPEWGYWPDYWRKWSPRHGLFRFLNEMAWSTEVVAGILMLIPATRLIGGLAILASFVFIATQIRLGFLCEMVVVACLLFVPEGSAPGAILQAIGSRLAVPSIGVSTWSPALQRALATLLWTYIALLPLARIGMYYNQIAHKRLPALFQSALDRYTNWFGLIIWRVFTADIVHFFIRIWDEPRTGGARTLLSTYQGLTWTHRFRQVAECITITSVFTTVKYYPSNRALFVERVLRYARSIPHPATSRLVFEWVNVQKTDRCFEFVPIVEYRADVGSGTVDETKLIDAVSVSNPARVSPIHEGARPGSYAPLKPV